MFHKMPLVLVAIIAAAFLLDGALSYEVKSQIFAVSLLVKSAIIASLPFIIFMLLFKTVAKLSKGATRIVFFILGAVCVSNFVSTMVSYLIGSGVYNFDLSLAIPQGTEGLLPAWAYVIPNPVSNDIAMFSGLFLGIFGSKVMPQQAAKLSELFDAIVSKAFKVITLLMPIFIAGFVLKLKHDKAIDMIAKDYAQIFTIVGLSLIAYISFLYFAASRFQFGAFFNSIKRMLPAGIAGFSSMSSSAALPLSIQACEKNTQNPLLARISVPTTVNVHLVGDCFAIPIFAFAVMKNYGMQEPMFYSYVIFALYFVVAKFSVAAIPGGGILVMLPILESQLGFTAEMTSMITALYLLFDPVITSANVVGNGGFAMVLDRIASSYVPQESSSSLGVTE